MQWLAALLALAVFASPADAGPGKETRPLLQLKQIAALEMAGATLSVRFVDGTLAVVDANAQGAIPLWIESAHEGGGYVAFDSADGSILPATTEAAVTLNGVSTVQVEGAARVVFGLLRPSPMYLKTGMPEYDRLAGLIDQAIAEYAGAAFALRDSFWIEDVVVVPRPEWLTRHQSD